MNNFTIPFLLVFLSGFSMGHGQSFISDLEYTDCFLEDCTPFKNDSKVEFARLSLPEDYTNRQGNRVNLAIVILKAKSDHPERDPILFLPGGPGGQTFSRIELFLDHYLREKRDIILLDFRGIGYSDPEWCPWLQDKLWELITTDITPEMLSQRKSKLLDDCWEELRAQNINPNNYITPVVVRDLEVLRKALEIDQWNLYGISYGTRVGQAYLRDFPDGIRSVILDSPVPINYPLLGSILDTYREGLDRFFNTCHEDPSCHKAFPTLETDFHRTLESFKDNPLVIPTGKENHADLYINFHDFHLTFHQLLYYRDFYPAIPWLLKSIEQRDNEVFSNLYSMLEERAKSISASIYSAVSKYDYGLQMDFKPTSIDDPLHNALIYFDSDEQIYHNIDFLEMDSTEMQLFESNIPSLILSGSTDPITPPEFGKQIDDYLSQSYFFEFPGVGHAVSVGPECAKQVTADFVENPNRKPISDCIEELRLNPVNWITDIYYNPRIGSLATALTKNFNPILIGIFSGVLLTFLISLIWGLVNLIKKRSPTSKTVALRNWMVRITALLAVVFIALLLWYTAQTAEDYSILVLIGLVGWAGWIFFLTVPVIAGTFLSLWFYIKSIGYSGKASTLFYGIAHLSLLGLSAVIVYYQLFPAF